MAVTVLIKRRFVPDSEGKLEDLYREMRGLALTHEGYIGAETLKRVDVEGELLIVSKWQTIDDWSKWLVSKERREYQERIDALTNSDSKFEIYTH